MISELYIVYSGRCLDCGSSHEVAESAESRLAATALIARLSAANLDAGPKVIGALVGTARGGEPVILVALSGAARPDLPIAFVPGLRAHAATAAAEAEALRRISALDTALGAVRASLLQLDGDNLRHAMAARASTRLAESARRRADRHQERSMPSRPGGGPPNEDALRLLDDDARLERQRLRDETRRDKEELEQLERSESQLNATRLALLSERRQVSAALMTQIFEAYRLRSLGGRVASIKDALSSTGYERAVPTGTGDCAAPRLVAEAGRLGLARVSLSEVWWAPGDDRHGRPVGPCADRCQPLMGFLLCPAGGPSESHVA